MSPSDYMKKSFAAEAASLFKGETYELVFDPIVNPNFINNVKTALEEAYRESYSEELRIIDMRRDQKSGLHIVFCKMPSNS